MSSKAPAWFMTRVVLLGETVNLALSDPFFFLQIILSKDSAHKPTPPHPHPPAPGWNINEFEGSRGIFFLLVPSPWFHRET